MHQETHGVSQEKPSPSRSTRLFLHNKPVLIFVYVAIAI
jgi:hypothetical protein